MAEVTLEKVSKVYPNGVAAVLDVSLVVPDQAFVVLVGPSGCGKSTTLRMVAGLEEISRGVVRIGGRVVNDLPAKDRDVAMVFQNYALYPHMTVYRNLAFGLRLRGVPEPEIRARVEEAAGILGIGELLGRRPKELSGGQRQRVAVGRAIVRKPKAFLFDEPLSNLDAKMRVQMRLELSRLHRRLATTMIYVTHDQVEAMTLGDVIVVMKDGVIQQAAPPLEVYHRPANRFVAGFIGSPPMNFLEGALVADGGALWFDAGDVRLRVDPAHEPVLAGRAGEPLVCGLRPEDLRPAAGGSAALRARVDLVEPLGAETCVHLAAGRHVLVAKVPGTDLPSLGDELPLDPDMSRARYFAPATGAALV